MNNRFAQYHVRKRLVGFVVALALLAGAIAYPLLIGATNSANVDSGVEAPAYAGPVPGHGGGGGGG